MILRMHKGREKDFDAVRADILCALEDSGVSLEVVLESPDAPCSGEAFFRSV